MFKEKYLTEASYDALAALCVQLNIDPSIPNNAIAYTALRSLINAAAGVAAAMERRQHFHDARNDLRRKLDVAEQSLEIAQRDIQHHQSMISSLENAVDAFKAHGSIKSDAKSAPDQIKQNKIDATDPDMLKDGLAAIDSLLHSHDDEYPKLSNSRSLLLGVTQCFAGELLQACAKKAKVDDLVVISHIKATAGVVPDTFAPILLQLLGANKSLEEWFTHATAIPSEGKLTHGPRVVAPASNELATLLPQHSLDGCGSNCDNSREDGCEVGKLLPQAHLDYACCSCP
ncbi:hypothetical protein BCR44DRAFT_1504670 [Catenaria anguillulae PL171]|uniref:Uncharacterized protein n=1 Tax=Catenaria anguillulae PL171 TaxID=765915 RepID=A0A1Y2H5W3_9FUNG|nr:hypothetical protein BCR44DRAFT_1504670 [Catenaria anguillulae PL171]